MRRILRALIVEDSADDADLLLLALRRGGFDVEHERVQTEADMRTALTERHWDIIFSDYSMPQFSALAALAVLRQSGLDIPCVVVSGTVGEETAVAALQAGATDFLVKGSFVRLIPAVERELRESEVRAARRRTEEALRESEQRYRRIIETTNEGVLLVDAEATVTFVNGRLATMLGRARHEIIGNPVLEIVHEDSRPRVARSLGPVNDRVPGQAEVRLERKGPTELWVLLDTAPIIDARGRYEGALAMVMDVSHRKRLEDQLRQSQKMEAVGNLAGGVAHDFNNLLSVILGYTGFMLESIEEGDPMRDDLGEIARAAERGAELTRQLLAFSRRQVLQPRVVDLNQIVAGVEKMLRRLLEADIDLALLTAPTLGMTCADPAQIEQILMNLVVNARDAMPSGGKLAIETANVELDEAYTALHPEVAPGAYVMLAVTDTGAGMDAATQQRIFEPFFTTKERGKGTGLGLSTVFGIVKQSGGHIWVYSELEKGSTFKVYLPRVEATPDAQAATLAASSTLHGTETVLIVEDGEQLRLLLCTILRRLGYDVLDAQNGDAALRVCEQHPEKIDLLITDVVMPRMGGRELVERVAAMRPEIRAMYVSGYAESSVVHHGILDGGDAFLQKPVSADALARKVREVLDRPPQ